MSNVVTGDHNQVTFNFTGYTVEQHEERLREKEKQVTEKRNKAHGAEKLDLIKERDGYIAQLTDLTGSYEKLQKEFAERDEKVKKLEGVVGKEAVAKAREALKQGDTSEAKKLLTDTLEKSKSEAKAKPGAGGGSGL